MQRYNSIYFSTDTETLSHFVRSLMKATLMHAMSNDAECDVLKTFLAGQYNDSDAFDRLSDDICDILGADRNYVDEQLNKLIRVRFNRKQIKKDVITTARNSDDRSKYNAWAYAVVQKRAPQLLADISSDYVQFVTPEWIETHWEISAQAIRVNVMTDPDTHKITARISVEAYLL